MTISILTGFLELILYWSFLYYLAWDDNLFNRWLLDGTHPRLPRL